ncbi:MAG: ComEC/Rec2 family competence protein [Eubacterium sp.]|nr:ComEC/Rec2 family competence protein [Eubacterium sp.]
MFRKRPLCLVWILLMTAVCICKAAGAPVFGVPRLDAHAREMLGEKSADSGEIMGEENAHARGMPDEENAHTRGMLGEKSADSREKRDEMSADPDLLPEGGAVLTAQGTVISRRETASSMQYVLKSVYISRENKQQADSDQTILTGDSPVIFPRLLVTTSKENIYRIGAVLACRGAVKRIEEAGNPGQFDARAFYACSGIYYAVRQAEIRVLDEGGGFAENISLIRNRLTTRLELLLPEQSAGVLAGMLLGERALLDDEVRRNYQIGGIMHILAISGLHISMLGVGLFTLLQNVGMPLPAAAPAASVFMIIYCLLVGNPSSAIRAIVMFAVMMGARITRRSYDLLSAMSLAGILILLTHPGYLFLPGFQLSFAATTGTAVLDPLQRVLRKKAGVHAGQEKHLRTLLFQEKRYRNTYIKKAIGYLGDVLLPWSAITAATLPLTAWYYYEIPLLGVLANLIILPLIGPVLALGAAGCAASLFSLFLAGVILFPVHLYLSLTEYLLDGLRCVPQASWICGQPVLWQMILYYFLFAAGIFLFCRYQREKIFIMPLAGLLVLLLVRPAPKFMFTALDVGQGDGLVLRAGHTCTFLTDCGSTSVSEVGKYRLIPYLKQKGIRQIDGIFLTHGDEDHISGVEELLEEIAKKQVSIHIDTLFLPVWMKMPQAVSGGTDVGNNPPYSLAAGERARTDGTVDGAELIDEGQHGAENLAELCRSAGVKLVFLERGDLISAGSLQIRVLFPLPPSESSLSGNEGSMVLLASCEEFDVLLTGDLEGEGEEKLLSETARARSNQDMEGAEKDSYLETPTKWLNQKGSLPDGQQTQNLPDLKGIECLKVAHHGSKNASSEVFLELVKPEIAVISAGINNRYGHPHKETLKRLKGVSAEIYRTDQGGAVTVIYDGRHVYADVYKGNRMRLKKALG